MSAASATPPRVSDAISAVAGVQQASLDRRLRDRADHLLCRATAHISCARALPGRSLIPEIKANLSPPGQASLRTRLAARTRHTATRPHSLEAPSAAASAASATSAARAAACRRSAWRPNALNPHAALSMFKVDRHGTDATETRTQSLRAGTIHVDKLRTTQTTSETADFRSAQVDV